MMVLNNLFVLSWALRIMMDMSSRASWRLMDWKSSRSRRSLVWNLPFWALQSFMKLCLWIVILILHLLPLLTLTNKFVSHCRVSVLQYPNSYGKLVFGNVFLPIRTLQTPSAFLGRNFTGRQSFKVQLRLRMTWRPQIRKLGANIVLIKLFASNQISLGRNRLMLHCNQVSSCGTCWLEGGKGRVQCTLNFMSFVGRVMQSLCCLIYLLLDLHMHCVRAHMWLSWASLVPCISDSWEGHVFIPL